MKMKEDLKNVLYNRFDIRIIRCMQNLQRKPFLNYILLNIMESIIFHRFFISHQI